MTAAQVAGRTQLPCPKPGRSAAARREIVHITVESMPLAARDDIVLVPVTDLPPIPLGLIWVGAAEHERIRAIAGLARQMVP